MRTHVVQKGDTLWKIAKQYGVNFEELKSLNSHLANPDYVMPGMEIFLPDNVSTGSNRGKTATTRTTSYKEKLTEPIIPISEAPTAPVQEPAPVVEEAPVQEVPSSKEKLTQPQPLPEYIMPQPVPTPPPMPQPQPEVMPDFHLDFAPQLHFTQPVTQTLPTPQPQPVPMPMIMPQQQPQPMPMPMPMPMPQPIMIQMPKPEVEEKEVTRTEFVPVPQPYYVYIPYIPEQVMPVHHPCPSHHHHVKPCGCGGNQQLPMHMQYAPMHMEQMPMMEMPCGCGGSQHFDSNFMEPQYFEPNYDIAPVMVDGDKDSNLPDWLEDSSSSEDNNLGHELGFDHKYNYDDYSQLQEASVPEFYQGSPNEHVMGYPMQQMPYMPHYVMPDQMMPHHMMQQQMMYPMYQNYPFMNQNLPHQNPWNY